MPKPPKKIATLTHGTASRKNIPTAEFESVMDSCRPRFDHALRMLVGIVISIRSSSGVARTSVMLPILSFRLRLCSFRRRCIPRF